MRGMNAKLILKEKTDEKVVYCYSADSSTFGNRIEDVIVDGEIECAFVPGEPGIIECQTLKTATNDNDGGQAEWLYNHLWRVIFIENCPPTLFFATG